MEHGRQNLNLQLYFTTNNTDERKKNRQVDQTFLGLSIFCESVGNSRPPCHLTSIFYNLSTSMAFLCFGSATLSLAFVIITHTQDRRSIYRIYLCV